LRTFKGILRRRCAGGSVATDDKREVTLGYYPTLVRLDQLRNEQQNEKEFARTLTYFQALAGGGSISKLQVDQVRQAYLASRSAVLQLKRVYADAVDQFKIQLGLPAELPLALDDSLLEPLTAQMRRYEAVEKTYTATLAEVQQLGPRRAGSGQLRVALRKILATSDLLRGTRLQQEILQRWDALGGLDKELEDQFAGASAATHRAKKSTRAP